MAVRLQTSVETVHSPELVALGIEVTLQAALPGACDCVPVFTQWRVVTPLRGNRRCNVFTIDSNLQVPTVSSYLQLCDLNNN